MIKLDEQCIHAYFLKKGYTRAYFLMNNIIELTREEKLTYIKIYIYRLLFYMHTQISFDFYNVEGRVIRNV